MQKTLHIAALFLLTFTLCQLHAMEEESYQMNSWRWVFSDDQVSSDTDSQDSETEVTGITETECVRQIMPPKHLAARLAMKRKILAESQVHNAIQKRKAALQKLRFANSAKQHAGKLLLNKFRSLYPI